MSSIQDPQFEKQLKCTQCTSSMGPVRVHDGTGGKQEHRGRIVQTCSHARCHWTCYHTKDSFIYEDAVAFVHRYNARCIGAPVPAQFMSAPLRRSEPTEPPTLVNGNIDCQNLGCRTAGGNRTRGSQQCIEFKCKRCCQSAADDATDTQKPRDPCKAHKIDLVSDYQYHQPVVPAPQVSIPQAARRRQGNAPQQAERRQPLAQPIGPLWRNTHQSADEAKVATENLKARRLEMEAREKRTCELVIYFKARSAPLILQEYIDTYPRLQLSSLPNLTEALELNGNSRLDHWNNGCWKTIYISSVLLVAHDQRTLIKLRPSLLEELALADCPGLSEELTRQPRIHGQKRAGGSEQLVSPSKKIAKQTGDATITDASRAAHAHADKASSLPSISPALLPPPALPLTTEPITMPAVPPPVAAALKSQNKDRWIQEMSVSEWVEKWQAVKRLQDSDPKYKTEKAAYPEIFKHDYKKATVHKYKALYDSVPGRALRDKYTAMEGTGASWAHMMHEMKTYRVGNEPSAVDTPSAAATPMTASPTISSTMPPVSSPGPTSSAALKSPTASNLTSLSQPRVDQTNLPHAPVPDPLHTPLMPPTSEQRLRLPGHFDDSDPRPTPDLDTPLRPIRLATTSDFDLDMDVLNSMSYGEEPQYLALPELKGWSDRFEEQLEGIFEDPTASDFFIQAEQRRHGQPSQPFHRPIQFFGETAYDKISYVVEELYNDQESDIDPTSYAPLTFREFIQEVIIQEVHTLLVSEALSSSPGLPPMQLALAVPPVQLALAVPPVQSPSTPHLPSAQLLAPDPTIATAQPTATTNAFPALSPLLNLPELPPLAFPTFHIKLEPEENVLEADPDTLCPFCDQELPISPSAELIALGVRMGEISVADPIPGNSRHRTPTSMVHVQGYCELHRMERDILPLAIAGNWPFSPDFPALFDRILALGPELIELSEELENSSFFRASKAHYTSSSSSSSGPGTQPMSMTQMMSIGQQYSSTNRLREQSAGYYGEIGYEIFTIALRFMFPDTDIASRAPLPYDIILREVLLPEAVVRIVQQDLKITPRAAKLVISVSYLFGTTRHPSSADCPAIASAVHYTTKIQQRAKSAYRLWVASGSRLALNDWVKLQRVKLEPKEVIMPVATKTVIDLTESEDEMS
ncbi:hypothetical protein B0H13DRAFT_1874862 [Mycena leptocephala]|nr:hypothetical protein B0H13DRAFT_1874862 [Mycena leptocephala]